MVWKAGTVAPVREQLPTGFAGLPVELRVQHSCGCAWRWHFFLQRPDSTQLDGRAVMAAGLAASLLCPRCDGTLSEPGDVSYAPTGVCHAHDGACPESPHAQWLERLGVRYRGALYL